MIGVCTAYAMCKAGHDVTLIEQGEEIAGGASAYNGAQLSYAYGDAMASPELMRSMSGICFGRDPSFNVNLVIDPDYLFWGLRFLRNSAAHRWRHNTRKILEISCQSEILMPQLLEEFEIDFSYNVSGKMHLYSTLDVAALSTRPAVELKRQLGIEQRVLSRSEALMIEPQLQEYGGTIQSVLFSPNDAVGDAQQFCRQLVDQLHSKYSLNIKFGAEVVRVGHQANRVTGVKFQAGDSLACEAVIVCTGNSHKLLRQLLSGYGLMWPIQGYSFTTTLNEALPMVSITDVEQKLVFARLGNRLRVAGLADIGRRAPVFSPARFSTLLDRAKQSFPSLLSQVTSSGVMSWTGARPATPSSVPIIRSGKLRGSYINMGHGMLGWTLALGSAQRVAELVSKQLD